MDYPNSVTLKDETTIPWAYYAITDEDYSEEEKRLECIAFILRVFFIVIYSVAFLVGTIGNGVVIFFTVFVMKRTVNVVWFLNLAIADFLFSFFLPLSITHVTLNFHWPFGKFMCKLNHTVLFINLYASIFLLTVISVDRYISVVFPVWCQNHRTPRLASLVAGAVWILAFIFSIPYAIFRDINDNAEDYVSCYNNFHADEDIAYSRHKATEDQVVASSIHKGMIIIRLIFSFIIPFTVIILCYAVIISRIQRNRMKHNWQAI
ncbi:unnamed protein product [Staurois parvus]|uniref:G-protein coupled receptors family 1 profile domain-containing protein n=1 Tax=Staurois parvus TaxID=386267 RepID=A0ABN9AU67_9NEOB|nr:unnamed protein product [Staurois parvus]